MLTAYRLWDPVSPFRALSRHSALILQMAKRDVIGRYRGSFVGLLWSFFNPLLMLLVYTFVFGLIFKARWTPQNSSHVDFALILFAGLNINTLFADCANRAPTLVTDNANYVKRIVFPLETLTWSTLGSALFHFLISTGVLLIIALLAHHALPWTVIMLPLVVAAFVPFIAGTVWLLASLGVFLRDLRQAIGIITTVLMFLSPIFYPIENVHGAFRYAIYLNPLTEIVIASRDVLVWGRSPNWVLLGVYATCALVFAWASFVWFEKTRKGFADVL